MSLNGKERAGEHNFLLHIFTSLKRKQRFFKYMFTIHTLFLRLRFRLVRQEILLRFGFQIRSSLWTKEPGPFDKLRDRGTFGTVSELAELPDISCARVKDTAWVINAKNGTPHTRS